MEQLIVVKRDKNNHKWIIKENNISEQVNVCIEYKDITLAEYEKIKNKMIIKIKDIKPKEVQIKGLNA